MSVPTLRLIEITIAPDGQSKVETQGFTGGECREAGRLIERALGRQVSEQLTAEYYSVDTSQSDQQQENS